MDSQYIYIIFYNIKNDRQTIDLKLSVRHMTKFLTVFFPGILFQFARLRASVNDRRDKFILLNKSRTCILREYRIQVAYQKQSLTFLHRENKCLTPALRRLLCNALIQPHFDYASSAWYPNLTQKMKNKIQTTQNKCIRYCLQLDKMTHISKNEFENLNWLPVKRQIQKIRKFNCFQIFY